MKTPPNVFVHVVTLLLLGAAVFLPDLGQEVRVTGREARHAEIARVMVERGEYMVPYVYGRPYINKPPLFNWTVAAFFRMGNRVDWAVARLPSALCAIAAMLGIYALGRRWFTARAGMFAATLWVTFWLVIEWGRLSRMDMMMACLILYAILLADVAATTPAGWRRMALWCGACVVIALAILSKGPVSLFFFLLGLVALWRARHGRWIPPLRFPLIGLGVIAVVVAVWAASAELGHLGHLKELLHYQFGVGLVEHPKRILLYVDQLLIRTAPWGLFAIGAGYAAIVRLRRNGYDRTLIPALVLAASLILMTVLPNKGAHYLLPLLPMWALFLGGFLDQQAGFRRTDADEPQPRAADVPDWAFHWPLTILLTVMLPALVALFVYWARYATGRRWSGTLLLGAAIVLTAGGAVAAWRRRTAGAVAILFMTMALLAVAVYPVLLVQLYRPAEDNVAIGEVAELIPPGAPVAEYEVRNEYLCFKLNRPLVFTETPEDVRAFMAGIGRRYLVVHADHAEQVMGLTSRPVRRIGSWEAGKFKTTVLEVGPEAISGAD